MTRLLPRRLIIATLLLSTLLAVLAGCATNPVTGRQDFVLMSEAEEISLGRKYHQQVLKEMPPYDDPRLAAYVEEVGQRMARVSDRPGLDYHFTLLDSTQVNAFALPGGYIYITRTLLAYLNSEAELAAVLGHEIGHVTARHSVRQQSAATVTGMAGLILQAATGARAASDLFNVLGKALLSGYGREHELESDRLGARYLARAGYDPQAMIRVIGVLKDQELFERQRAREEGREPRVYHGLFASHPENDQRLQEVVAEAGRLPPGSGRHVAEADFLDYLDGLAFGDSEASGIVLKDRFLHKPLDFGLRFPDGWRIENLTDRLVALAPGDKAYLEVRVDTRGARLPPVRYLKKQGFTDIRGGRHLRIAGREAYTALTDIDTRMGRRTARLVTLRDGARRFLFMGLSRDNRAMRNFDDDFLDVARSFHKLSAQEKKLAAGLHIHIVTARPGTRFADLARNSPIPRYAEAQLRLLNHLYPNGEPQAGQRLKIVR